MIDQTFLKENLLAYGLPCPDGLTEKLDRYAGLLVEWNEKMNLTAITDPEGIAVKHFLDSLLLLKACPLPEGRLSSTSGPAPVSRRCRWRPPGRISG